MSKIFLRMPTSIFNLVIKVISEIESLFYFCDQSLQYFEIHGLVKGLIKTDEESLFGLD